MKVLVFYDPEFPFDGKRPNQKFINLMQSHSSITFVNHLNLVAELDRHPDVFVNLHGPYFLKGAWPSILGQLRAGTGFIHAGGAPFRIPCYQKNGNWILEREQTAYHQTLNIHEVLPVAPEPIDRLAANPDLPLLENKEHLFSIEATKNFILHVSKTSVFPKEMGSSGPMDAVIRPLLKGISNDGREVAAPVVLIENTNGDFKGGRWLFINQILDERFWSAQGAEALMEWVYFSACGVTEMWLKTNYAMYEEAERPEIRLQVQHTQNAECQWQFSITIEKENETVAETKLFVESNTDLTFLQYRPKLKVTPGFYQITCIAAAETGERRVLHQGFWGMDRKLLSEGEPLAIGRDYFHKNGRPFPIVGMTYMTSDVARYYLFLPNPYLWEKDFRQMKKAGINYIRTGIWTGWQQMMFADGHTREDVLRAIDAFILCAKKHDLEVTFTFFSFTPEMWQGVNPYLDPRSVEAQKRFVVSIVSRHAETTNVQWDLINEPSLFDPDHTFAGPRTLGDRFDRAHFIDWLKVRHENIRELQERWNTTNEELPDFTAVTLPRASEINFDLQDMLAGKKGLKWLDYTLYTMDIHNKWASELTDTIKKIVPDQLVTVGQDEALGAQRPSPLFYGEAVDYTTNHTWWLLDQLLWDGIFSKTAGKPNLIQETGIMYVESPDNQAKRSEAELRNILERKYAYAFAAAGAGAVQWLWNTNYYMDNINESNIGAVRADGTEKPEAKVSYDFGDFINNIRDLFGDRELETIGVVFPYSNDFSNRPLAFDATTKLTRVLAYELNRPFRAISEYHLEDLETDTPKLLIIPSAHNFDTEAFLQILSIVEEKGITLLITGPLNLDAYWNKTTRAEELFGPTNLKNVVREEALQIGGHSYPVSFGDRRIGEVWIEVPKKGSAATLQEITYGQGKVIWSPLPLELNERTDVLRAVYHHAIQKASIPEELQWLKGDTPGIYGRKLKFPGGNLFVFVSEYGLDQKVKVKDTSTDGIYGFTLVSDRSVLFATDTKGHILKVYRETEVSIDTKL